MQTCDLFRLRVELPPLFSRTADRPQLLAEAIQTDGRVAGRSGSQWLLGDVHQLDATGFSLKIGRISRRHESVFDAEGRTFTQEQREGAAVSRILLDTEWEAFALTRNSVLSKRPLTVARKFAQLLTEEVQESRLAVVAADGIRDPREFVERLLASHAIHRFRARFPLPNAFDADEMFVEPVQRCVEAIGGRDGALSVRGWNLDKQRVADIARTAALMGSSASATVQISSDSSATITHRMDDELATMTCDSLSTLELQAQQLSALRTLVRELRGLS